MRRKRYTVQRNYLSPGQISISPGRIIYRPDKSLYRPYGVFFFTWYSVRTVENITHLSYNRNIKINIINSMACTKEHLTKSGVIACSRVVQQ